MTGPSAENHTTNRGTTMPSARAIELHLEVTTPGATRLEIISEDSSGERFVIDLVGPEADVRAEAEFLAEQYHLAVA